MFGYIKPFKPELKIKEYEVYKGIYCSLCRRLGKLYGLPAKIFLSYDLTFMSIMGIALSNEEFCLKKGRCGANPLKKCTYCIHAGKHIDFAAALSVILFYYKLKDNVHDSGFWGKIISYIPYPAASAMRRKAAKNFPALDAIAAEMMQKQERAEKQENCPVDEAAEPTAYAIGEYASMLAQEESQKETLRNLGYHLGRWIYFIDAQEDLLDDVKKHRFNPFAQKLTDSSSETINHVRQYANGLMNLSMAQILEAYENLQLKKLTSIIENIFKLGMAESQRNAFLKKEKEK